MYYYISESTYADLIPGTNKHSTRNAPHQENTMKKPHISKKIEM